MLVISGCAAGLDSQDVMSTHVEQLITGVPWRHRDGTSQRRRQEESSEIALLELVKHAGFPGIGADPAILKTK